MRVRAVPLQPCRRHGKKRKEDEPDAVIKKEAPAHRSPSVDHSPHRFVLISNFLKFYT